MMLLRDVGLCALWAGIVTANQSCGSPDVHVDVAIIGGGSGGIHAAIQLKDAGASVLVVEKKDKIGGHAETYVNPDTGVSANVGVVVFENRDIVHQYFTRLSVPFSVSTPNFGGGSSATYDFSTGVKVPPSTPAQSQQQQKAVQDAIQAYSKNVLSKYPWIDDGYLVPNPIPDELYMPFGELAHKYNFTALMPNMWAYNWYAGNITTLPSLYGIKNFGPGLLNSSAGGFVRPKSGVTTDLYVAAAKDLGSSVLLSSTVHSVDRHSKSGGVTIVVSQPNKPPQKIYAKKLLVAIPPTLKNVAKYDLSKNEKNLFSKFHALAYFAGVCHVPGFNTSLHNIGINTPFNQPIAPGNNGFGSTGSPGDFLIGGAFDTDAITDEDGTNLVGKNLATLAAAGAVRPDAAKVFTCPFTSNHAPFNLRVTSEEIKGGFYGELKKIQGSRNTYWTGATFSGHNSALVWNWNMGTVVPGLKKDLGLK